YSCSVRSGLVGGSLRSANWQVKVVAFVGSVCCGCVCGKLWEENGNSGTRIADCFGDESLPGGGFSGYHSDTGRRGAAEAQSSVLLCNESLHVIHPNVFAFSLVRSFRPCQVTVEARKSEPRLFRPTRG
ncbi:unnamed protein product, partial [Phaeothamnion confervicola]